jgi:hypothetical protein
VIAKALSEVNKRFIGLFVWLLFGKGWGCLFVVADEKTRGFFFGGKVREFVLCEWLEMMNKQYTICFELFNLLCELLLQLHNSFCLFASFRAGGVCACFQVYRRRSGQRVAPVYTSGQVWCQARNLA